jgi:hypothetical protein
MASDTVPSLIQGISQQAEIARQASSAGNQENCLNEVLDGAVSRMGSVVQASIATVYIDPFVHRINRTSGEKYLLLVEGGTIRIINRVTGVEAAITNTGAAYLTHVELARKSFQAVTVGDTTFLLNRERSPAIVVGDNSPNRNNWACAHFKSGGYKVTYTLSIIVAGTKFTTTYQTPDNSSEANAEYITTSHLAEQFRAALVSTVIPALTSAGHTGFSVARVGSTLIIKNSGTLAYDLTTEDGNGDRQFISFKDSVRTIADLPAKCQDGYQVQVSANGGQQAEAFYLKYGGAEGTGRWSEVVKWDTPREISGTTMAHVLVNTGVDTFTFGPANWGDRLAGDGTDTAQDPSFIGGFVTSLQYIGGRLAQVSEYTMTLSRSRNAYVYFPDTVQTNLDTAPVDYDVSNGSSTDIRHSVVAGGKLQFWGDGQQTYLDSGQDPIREDTTEILPLANYEYDGEAAPVPMGLGSLMFGTEIGTWQTVREVYFRAGKPDGEIEISGHVPKLISGKLRYLAVGEAAKKVFVLTDGDPNTAHLYQWYNQGNERVQSSWNIWKMPSPSKILWAGIEGSTLSLLLQWPFSCTLETLTLNSTGDETSERLPLRLDHRISEDAASWDVEGYYTLPLPYSVPSDKRDLFKAYMRTDDGDTSQRGIELVVTWNSSTSVRVRADSAVNFHFGAIPVSRLRRTRFFARDRQDNPILHDKLLIRKVIVAHKGSSQYSVVVTTFGVEGVAQVWTGRLLGDPSVINNQVPVKNGTFSASVGEETENVEIDLVNDSPYPAIWTSMKYVYDITVREA